MEQGKHQTFIWVDKRGRFHLNKEGYLGITYYNTELNDGEEDVSSVIGNNYLCPDIELRKNQAFIWVDRNGRFHLNKDGYLGITYCKRNNERDYVFTGVEKKILNCISEKNINHLMEPNFMNESLSNMGGKLDKFKRQPMKTVVGKEDISGSSGIGKDLLTSEVEEGIVYKLCDAPAEVGMIRNTYTSHSNSFTSDAKKINNLVLKSEETVILEKKNGRNCLVYRKEIVNSNITEQNENLIDKLDSFKSRMTEKNNPKMLKLKTSMEPKTLSRKHEFDKFNFLGNGPTTSKVEETYIEKLGEGKVYSYYREWSMVKVLERVTKQPLTKTKDKNESNCQSSCFKDESLRSNFEKMAYAYRRGVKKSVRIYRTQSTKLESGCNELPILENSVERVKKYKIFDRPTSRSDLEQFNGGTDELEIADLKMYQKAYEEMSEVSLEGKNTENYPFLGDTNVVCNKNLKNVQRIGKQIAESTSLDTSTQPGNTDTTEDSSSLPTFTILDFPDLVLEIILNKLCTDDLFKNVRGTCKVFYHLSSRILGFRLLKKLTPLRNCVVAMMSLKGNNRIAATFLFTRCFERRLPMYIRQLRRMAIVSKYLCKFKPDFV
ncbi:hypothetical protein C0J52_09356 [Blattella germanica]|nr:hypothetical protein C0J52_09356 [Blattella germanica]